MIRRHDSIIVHYVSNFLIPIIQLFALYVLFHGHYSPGGGFQAGVLIGASFILKFLVGSETVRNKFSLKNELVLASLGVLIFALTGLLGIFYGGNLFDYGYVELFGPEPAMRRYYGILIAEIGVTLVVAMVLLIIFHVLAFTVEQGQEPL